MIPRERAQVYTLEGVVAALIVMAGLLFALQATTATPQAGGIANPQAQHQDESIARDVLTVANDTELRQAVLYWDTGNESFHCIPGGVSYYPAPDTVQTSASGDCPDPDADRAEWVPPTQFGGLLDQHFGSGYSYNVYAAYHDGDEIERQRMVYQGQPGDGVVRASTSVALTDDDELYGADGSESGDEVGSNDFYAPNDASSDLYNVVHVEVVAWRG